MKTGMFNKGLVLMGLVLLTSMLHFSFADVVKSEAELPRWERLGSRKVKKSLDRDEILVTRREGRFSAVKLKVRKSGINLHRFVVHFVGGGQQEVKVRKNMPAGGETRVIDLRGRRRAISKVVFWYDTKGIAGNKAKVDLWGRH